MASDRPLLEGESHQLQGRSQEYQTPLACEGGMHGEVNWGCNQSRHGGPLTPPHTHSHTHKHTSFTHYHMVPNHPTHSLPLCLLALPRPLLCCPAHLMQGTMMLFIPPSLTLIFRQRLDRVWRLIFVTLRTCTHCVATPICVSPTRFTSAVSVCVLGREERRILHSC